MSHIYGGSPGHSLPIPLGHSIPTPTSEIRCRVRHHPMNGLLALIFILRISKGLEDPSGSYSVAPCPYSRSPSFSLSTYDSIFFTRFLIYPIDRSHALFCSAGGSSTCAKKAERGLLASASVVIVLALATHAVRTLCVTYNFGASL